MGMNDIYLAKDGNWGSAHGLLSFSSLDITDEMYDELENDPEGSYEVIKAHLENKEKGK